MYKRKIANLFVSTDHYMYIVIMNSHSLCIIYIVDIDVDGVQPEPPLQELQKDPSPGPRFVL